MKKSKHSIVWFGQVYFKKSVKDGLNPVKPRKKARNRDGDKCCQRGEQRQDAAWEETLELYRCLADIMKEICELKDNMKNDLKALNSSFRQEFASFKEDVNNKRVNSEEHQDQKTSLNEVQTTIDELETFSMEAKELCSRDYVNKESCRKN